MTVRTPNHVVEQNRVELSGSPFVLKNMLAIQSNKELMELFLRSTRNVIKPLCFEISILGYQFVLETTLLFLDLHNLKN
jgi:hypothetical protein